MRWSHTPLSQDPVRRLSQQATLSPIVASLLIRLGIFDPVEARVFLRPLLRNLADPFDIPHLGRAVERIRRGMSRGEHVLIFGDYDVDGVTSTVLLTEILRRFGVYPRYFIPNRLTEGYGLSPAAVDRALSEGPVDLLIAVDCGSNSRSAVASIVQRGIDVIVIDHHRARAEEIPDCLLVNPHIDHHRSEPWSELCAVGLVFKLVHGLLKKLRHEGDEAAWEIDLKTFLDLVALGTIADLVPLRGENRILAKAGLRSLRRTKRMGLNALCEVCGISIGDEVTPFDVSFKLGPRINASGRVSEAGPPVEMLLSNDWRKCCREARRLDHLNRQRQEIERKILLEAEDCARSEQPDAFGYVLYSEEWHPGVVGIVASRLVQSFHRPAIVLGEDGDLARGSGRSIPGVDLVEVLAACGEILENWGGHPMAVGVSVAHRNFNRFRRVFDQAIRRSVGGEMPEKEIEIAKWVEPEDLGKSLLDELTLMEPFGTANPIPIFGLRDIVLTRPPKVFGKSHFRFELHNRQGDGQSISGVAWKQSHRLPPVGEKIDMAVRIHWNLWNGRKNIQAELIDWRPVSGALGRS